MGGGGRDAGIDYLSAADWLCADFQGWRDTRPFAVLHAEIRWCECELLCAEDAYGQRLGLVGVLTSA